MMPHQFEEFGFEADDIPQVDVVKVLTISRFSISVPKFFAQFFFTQLWFNKENVSVRSYSCRTSDLQMLCQVNRSETA